MNKINWSVRFKNPLFLSQLFMAFFVPILGYFGLTAQDMTTWKSVGDLVVDAVSNPYVVSLIVVSVYNAITNPMSKGFGDSDEDLNK
ncbi:phage holin [Bacillus sp. T33-2]|uniref:phage holin n=1 Tax=Bacillus sp. T33-2 TaxID=2054168 RepID=UPI000C771734|nr:phage holin [Bacillus sp. T33-2]PLR99658.1 holin [Bacillus sp. T33-2]